MVWVASGSTADVDRAGPLVEYERRIAAGELVDGDSCQVRLNSALHSRLSFLRHKTRIMRVRMPNHANHFKHCILH